MCTYKVYVCICGSICAYARAGGADAAAAMCSNPLLSRTCWALPHVHQLPAVAQPCASVAFWHAATFVFEVLQRLTWQLVLVLFSRSCLGSALAICSKCYVLVYNAVVEFRIWFSMAS